MDSMKRGSVLLALLFAFSTPSLGESHMDFTNRRNDYPFQCGATFSIMAQVYQMAGDASKSAEYQAKFDKLAIQAEAAFKLLNKTRKDAEAYMQQYAEDLAVIGEKDAKLVINFAQRCNELFPN